MPINVTCACGQTYPIREEFAGQRVQCPACQQMLTIPLPPTMPLANRVQPPVVDEVDDDKEVGEDEEVDEAEPVKKGGGATWLLLGCLVFTFVLCGGGGVAAVIVAVALSPTETSEALNRTIPNPPPPPPPALPPPALPPPAPPPVVPPPRPPPAPPPPPVVPSQPTLADFVKKLDDPEARTRLEAAKQLGRYGEELRPHVPTLLKVLARDDAALRSELLPILKKLGPRMRAEGPLLELLSKERSSAPVRLYALENLVALGADYPATPPAVQDAISDPDVMMKRQGIQLAGQLGPAGRDALSKSLLDALGDADADVSKDAAAALAKMGKPTAKETPLLNDMLRSDKKAIRRYAVVALTDLGPDAAQALPRLSETLQIDSDPEQRRLALLAVVKVQANKKDAVGTVKQGLRDPDPEVAKQAVACLASLLPAEEALAAVLEALTSPNAAVAKAAEDALPGIKFERSHMKVLTAALRTSKSESLRLRLVETLVALKPDTSDVAVAFVGFLNDAKGEARVKIVKAIGELGSVGRDAGDALVEALRDKDEDRMVRFEAALALCKTRSEQAPQAVPMLVASLRVDNVNDKDAVGRQEQAHKALVQLGKPAVNALADALEKDFFGGGLTTPAGLSKANARGVVILTLSLMGADAKDALPALGASIREDPLPANKEAARAARTRIQAAVDGK